MKFRMAEKSLFAILLRSPWWISLGVAGVIALVAQLALPADMVVFGAMGGLPFLVIAVMAARRQWRLPSAARVRHTLEAVRAMTWPDFAVALEDGWRREGYSVARRERPPGREGGRADFTIQKAGVTTLVSCRRWKAASLGLEPLRELQAAMAQANAHDGICIALGVVTEPASHYAHDHGIRVMQAGELAQLLRRTPLGASRA